MELAPRSRRGRARAAELECALRRRRPDTRFSTEMSADAVYMAKLAEQAERYEEMVEYMKKVAMEKPAADDLSPRSGNFFVAHKDQGRAPRVARIIG